MTALDAEHPRRPFAPVALAVSFALCFAVSAVGNAVTLPQIGGWYASLAKPAFNPPNWLFGPVWTVLFIIMALVLWQIWRTPATGAAAVGARRRALTAFGVQLALNMAWSIAFFGLQSPPAALAVIVAFWAAILWTMLAARPVIGSAAYAFVPYLAWVSYATVLNATIVAIN